MKKFKWYYDKDKEIEWLDQMSQEGWELKDFKAGLYTFVPCKPSEWRYDVDLNDQVVRLSSAYRDFLEDAHIEVVCQWGVWFIAKRKAAYGPFQLYADRLSRIEQYKRIRTMFKVSALIELVIFYLESWAFFMSNDWLFFGLALLILAMFLVLFRAAIETNKKIARLKGEIVSTDRSGKRLVQIGILFSCIFMLARDVIPDPIACFGMGIGVAFELVGLLRMKKDIA